MTALEGKIILCENVQSHDFATKSKRRPFIVLGSGKRYGIPQNCLVGVPMTTSPIAVFAHSYVSLKKRLLWPHDNVESNRAMVVDDDTSHALDPFSLQTRLNAMQAELDPSQGPVSNMANHAKLMQDQNRVKQCEHSFADLELCVAIPRTTQYMSVKPKAINELTRSAFAELCQQVDAKFEFPQIDRFFRPVHAELTKPKMPGSLVYFNYSAVKDFALRNRGWVGAAYVVGEGEEYGFAKSSLLVCPLDYKKPAAPVPNLYPTLRNIFQNLERDAIYPQVDQLLVVPQTCRYFYTGQLGLVDDQTAERIRMAVVPDQISSRELNRHLRSIRSSTDMTVALRRNDPRPQAPNTNGL